MRKNSNRQVNLTESRGRCERGRGAFGEWSFEGGRKRGSASSNRRENAPVINA